MSLVEREYGGRLCSCIQCVLGHSELGKILSRDEAVLEDYELGIPLSKDNELGTFV
jgi:hypothetical protein